MDRGDKAYCLHLGTEMVVIKPAARILHAVLLVVWESELSLPPGIFQLLWMGLGQMCRIKLSSSFFQAAHKIVPGIRIHSWYDPHSMRFIHIEKGGNWWNLLV